MAERTQLVTALDVLGEQRAHIEALFDQVQRDRLDRAAAFADLVDALQAHLATQDRVLYPRIALEGTAALVRAALDRHQAIRRMLADLLAYDFEEDDFAIRLALLRKAWQRAHDEDERALFPALRRGVPTAQLSQLGIELGALWRALTQPASQEPEAAVDNVLPLSA